MKKITVEVNLKGRLREIARTPRTMISIRENATVMDLIDELSLSLGLSFRKEVLSSSGILQDYLFLIINDKLFQARKETMMEVLKDSDRVSFLYVTAGGSWKLHNFEVKARSRQRILKSTRKAPFRI